MEKLNFSECTLYGRNIWLDTCRQQQIAGSVDRATNHELDDLDKGIVSRLWSALQKNVAHWNEYDLSLHFIGPIFSAVSFTEKMRFNLFAQRNLEAEIAQIKLMGRVDEVIASGYRTPKLPFFAFNEYKKETNPDGDPGGQVLGAMLVGQHQNIAAGNDFPVYGCYVIGRNWFFVVLEGRKYATSKPFVSTEYNDSLQILRILFQLKVYCMERTAHIVVVG
jgi:hypothetical protein